MVVYDTVTAALLCGVAALLAQFFVQLLTLPWASRLHREATAAAGPFRATGDWRAGIVVPVVAPLVSGAALVAAHAALAGPPPEPDAESAPYLRGVALALLLWLAGAAPALLLDYARFRVSLLAVSLLALQSLAGAAAAGLALGMSRA
jgi:hypothetical protein